MQWRGLGSRQCPVWWGTSAGPATSYAGLFALNCGQQATGSLRLGVAQLQSRPQQQRRFRRGPGVRRQALAGTRLLELGKGVSWQLPWQEPERPRPCEAAGRLSVQHRAALARQHEAVVPLDQHPLLELVEPLQPRHARKVGSAQVRSLDRQSAVMCAARPICAACLRACERACVRASVRVLARACRRVRACVHASVRACECVCERACVRACVSVYVCARAYSTRCAVLRCSLLCCAVCVCLHEYVYLHARVSLCGSAPSRVRTVRVCARARICMRASVCARACALVEHVRRVGYVPAERDEPLPLRRHAARPDRPGKAR